MKKFLIFLIVILSIRMALYQLQPHKPNYQQNLNKNSVTPAVFTKIKSQIGETYNQNLSRRDASLLMGIVFGDHLLDRGSTKLFQKTGVLHVIAASGMNVSILISVLLGIMVLFFRRQRALLITFVCVLFYVGLADFQPSIIRAAIMAGAALGAGIVGRQNTSILALFFAAFLMLFWDPSIITSVSFLLSFAATGGIILIDPLFKKYVSKNEVLEDFRTTFAAQIATTPIILFFFGSYSPISILVNLLILWTVAPLMILGGIAAILGLLSPILAAPFVVATRPILAYFWIVVEYFSKYAFQLKFESFPWSLIVGYYLILAAIIFSLYRKKKNGADTSNSV